MSELRDCPFCGAPAVYVKRQGVLWVVCAGQKSCPLYQNEYEPAAWNTRASDADVAELERQVIFAHREVDKQTAVILEQRKELARMTDLARRLYDLVEEIQYVTRPKGECADVCVHEMIGRKLLSEARAAGLGGE